MISKPGSADRILGCLLGGALGDAMGSAVEGQPPLIDLPPPERWSLTDDTQLTLATCEALLNQRAVSPEAIAERLVAWHTSRRLRGLGASTLKALTELEAGGHWALVGRGGEQAAGNGAAMRAAPLAFLLDARDEDDRRIIRDVARITHRHDEAYAGALAVVAAIRGAWLQDWPVARRYFAMFVACFPIRWCATNWIKSLGSTGIGHSVRSPRSQAVQDTSWSQFHWPSLLQLVLSNSGLKP